MSNVFGSKIKISVFGESHGECLGVIVDGLPSGVTLDLDSIEADLRRRRGGKKLSTSRIEQDLPKIVSGYFNNKTTGTPLCAIFENSNTMSKDYDKTKNLLRPSHADYTGYVKYKGFNDYRGGGHFSGRVTVLLVFVGAICKQLLLKQGVKINSHILQIHNIKDVDLNDCSSEYINNVEINEYFIDKDKEVEALNLIEQVKNDNDSIGAIVQCCAIGIEAGIGSPFFNSLESQISQLAFSIPGIKGIEFGLGFDFVSGYGSTLNDQYTIIDGKIVTTTNNNGGILGGISTGMPIVYNLAVKPTPSILKEQNSVNIETLEETTLLIEGRHDPCIAIRVLPVVEAITAIAILDLVGC